MATSPHEFVPPPGRGTPANPANRFERLHLEVLGEDMDALLASDPDVDPDVAARRPRTEVFRDHAATILRRNDSPDLRFDVSLNPYRGCEHGCAYCYARPYHEYLGFSAGLDFETRILVKEDAPALLRRELSAPSWIPRPIACSGVTDCYQPLERRLRITRACLEVLRDFRNPVTVITKNHLVTRDLDILADLAARDAAAVLLSVTSLDPDLARDLEPRASAPAFRLQAIRALADAGIPVGVSVAPLIPGLNDHEAPAILQAARDHGATFAVWAALRLPHGVGELFLDWMESHRPARRQRVENNIRRMRNGNLDESAFGERFRGTGTEADALARLFEVARRRAGLASRTPELSATSFRRVLPDQPELF